MQQQVKKAMDKQQLVSQKHSNNADNLSLDNKQQSKLRAEVKIEEFMFTQSIVCH